MDSFQSYYGWENVEIAVVRPSNLDPNGPCSGAAPSDDFLIVRLQPDRQYVEVTMHVFILLQSTKLVENSYSLFLRESAKVFL